MATTHDNVVAFLRQWVALSRVHGAQAAQRWRPVFTEVVPLASALADDVGFQRPSLVVGSVRLRGPDLGTDPVDTTRGS
jgi:hypothetical protein